MDTRIQIDAILTNLFETTEQGVNIMLLNVDYEAGTISVTVGE
jgi:hypothetical protein